MIAGKTSEVSKISEVCAFAAQMVAEKTVRIDRAEEILKSYK